MNTRTIAAVLSGVLAALAGPAAALAAKAKNVEAPKLEPSLPLWSLLCTIVVLAGVCVVVFKRPRRAQMD